MERKIIGFSDPFTIKVPHSCSMVQSYGNGLIEIPQDQLLEVTIRFLYTDEDFSYSDDDYWFYNEKDNTVYVKIDNSYRLKYLACMKKKLDGLTLTREEELVIEDFEVITQTVSRVAAEKAVKQFEERMKIYAAALSEIKVSDEEIVVEPTEPEEKKEYRTKAKAGEVAEIPSKIPIITNELYQNAMTYNNNDTAYLQPLSSIEDIVFQDGYLYVKGLQATAVQLKHLFTNTNIETFNLPMLKVFYAIILDNFAKTISEDNSISPNVKIYYPELAKKLGRDKTNKDDYNSMINAILSYANIVGIINKGKRGNDILPVLQFVENNVDDNTITFSSPYITRIIKELYNVSIRKDKLGKVITDKKGEPKMLPSHTYIPHLDLGKERNQKAVEIVFIVVTTIEQAGSHGTPHISAKTIVERNQLLKQSIDNASRLSNKNTYLERAFSKAWQLLRTHTDILERYKNIQLPNPKDKDFKAKYIPTMNTLDMVFEFPHEGKIKD